MHEDSGVFSNTLQTNIFMLFIVKISVNICAGYVELIINGVVFTFFFVPKNSHHV